MLGHVESELKKPGVEHRYDRSTYVFLNLFNNSDTALALWKALGPRVLHKATNLILTTVPQSRKPIFDESGLVEAYNL